MSGGLFFILGGPIGFSGIHVGGNRQISQNFVIPTSNFNLALYYFRAISINTEDFKAMDPASLKPYYDHFASRLPLRSPPSCWFLLIEV